MSPNVELSTAHIVPGFGRVPSLIYVLATPSEHLEMAERLVCYVHWLACVFTE